MPLVRSKLAAEPPAEPAASVDAQALGGDGESGSLEERLAAVRKAARLGDADSLARGLTVDADPAVREAILMGLVRIGGVEAARPLIEVLRGSDAPLRNAAIEALQGMGEPILGEIETLLHDDIVDVRIYAVNVLQFLRSARVPGIALQLLEVETNVNVCAAALEILGDVGRPDMVPKLEALIPRFPAEPFLKFTVRAIIQRIR